MEVRLEGFCVAREDSPDQICIVIEVLHRHSCPTQLRCGYGENPSPQPAIFAVDDQTR
jgi:hypothetical protein